VNKSSQAVLAAALKALGNDRSPPRSVLCACGLLEHGSNGKCVKSHIEALTILDADLFQF
jgi:hypothetical protein